MKKREEIELKTLADIEKNWFPKYHKEKMKERHILEGFKNYHMPEIFEIRELIKTILEKHRK